MESRKVAASSAPAACARGVRAGARWGDVDKRQLVDESLSLNDGAIMYPGMKVDSWMWRAYAESGLYPADVPG